MQSIFIIGAGKSSSVLIQYLLERAESNDWYITVGDLSEAAARQRVGNHPKGNAISFNMEDASHRAECIRQADLVISMLPANFHLPVATDCIRFGKHFLSASYVSPEMANLDAAAKEKGVLLMNECGLDPGIDHMSAMRMIHEVEKEGGQVTLFESYAGGLIAPESDTNPWHYKLTWNPRNIVLSGQGVAKFFWQNEVKIIPYNKLFQRYDILEIPGYGEFEGYPNRDSSKYKSLYGLTDTHTLVRGTLRKRGYCDAWNALVQLGVTDESYTVDLAEGCTWNEFVASYLPQEPELSTKENFTAYFKLASQPEVIERLEWLGIFSDLPVGATTETPAKLLQSLLEEKWSLEPGDKDMIVMLHKMEFNRSGTSYEAQMSLTVCGKDEVFTGMAQTVGLPLAIAAKYILNGTFNRTGVVIPLTADIYEPILKELEEDFDIRFMHQLKEC